VGLEGDRKRVLHAIMRSRQNLKGWVGGGRETRAPKNFTARHDKDVASKSTYLTTLGRKEAIKKKKAKKQKGK
jgi:hypothetical protein